MDGLDAGGVIHVGHRRQRRAGHVELVDAKQGLLLRGHGPAVLGLYPRHQQHVRTGLARLQFKPFAGLFCQHRGGKGAETLAVFDLQVHHALHLWGARIPQD